MSDTPKLPADLRHYAWSAAVAACKRPHRESMHPFWFAKRCGADGSTPPPSASASGYGADWYGGLTYDGMMELASGQREWRKGRDEIERRAREQALRNVRKLPARDFAYDVEGEFFDVAAVVEGRPETWLTPVHATVGERAAVRLVIDVSTSCNIDADAMCERMFTVASTALTLECAGIATEVIAINCCADSPGYCISVQVNNAGEPIDVTRLIAVAHPSFLRRVCFRLQEMTTVDRVAKAYYSGYGHVLALAPRAFTHVFGPHAYLIPGLDSGRGLADTVKALNDILTAQAMPAL